MPVRDSWINDTWSLADSSSARELSFDWKGITLFSFPQQPFPPPIPDADDHSALAPRAKKPPTEPSPQERARRNLTHLPFRAWRATCTQAESRQDKAESRPHLAESRI